MHETVCFTLLRVPPSSLVLSLAFWGNSYLLRLWCLQVGEGSSNQVDTQEENMKETPEAVPDEESLKITTPAALTKKRGVRSPLLTPEIYCSVTVSSC